MLITLMFHEVTDTPHTTGFQRASAAAYKHPVSAFRATLDQIALIGRLPERVDDLGNSDRHLLLTFDDGGRSAMTAADMLQERGWIGHFFIVTGFLETSCFLTRAQVRELHARGHLIGSHSHTHPDVFKRLPYDRMCDEWQRSRSVLEEVIGASVRTASIPGGHGSARTERAAAAAGYQFLFTSQPSLRVRKTGDMLCIGRVCLKSRTPPARAGELASGRGFSRERCLWYGKRAARTLFDMPRALMPATRSEA